MTRDQKIDIGVAVGAATLFVLGLRRVSALVGIGTGVWYLTRDRKVAGYSSLGLGAAFLVMPNLPEAAAAAVGLLASRSRPADPYTLPVGSQSGGKLNLDLGGGWILLDVAELQSDKGRAALARGLPVGTVVPLALSFHNAPAVIYQARTIAGGSLGTYPGQWADSAPPGGPQMVEFRNEHVLL